MIEGYYEKGFCYRSEKYKLIFISVSKNATTSIKAIREFGFVQDNILRFQKDELKCYSVFTVVRDPRRRLISAYLEVCSRASMDSPHIIRYPFYWCKNQKKRFVMFLDELESGCFDVHLLPQYYFLTDQRDNVFEFDYILNLENLNSEFKEMQHDLGIEPAFKLSRRNTYAEKNKSWVPLLIQNIKNLLGQKDEYEKASCIPLIYVIADKIYRFFIRRAVPDCGMLTSLIGSSSEIRGRIEFLLAKDIRFYDNIMK